jgi:hypothetical protein
VIEGLRKLMVAFAVGDIVIMETHIPPLPDHFVIWRLTDVSDPGRLQRRHC